MVNRSLDYLAGNALVCGDNYVALRELPDECIDLIYLDPPFNSNQFYVAAFGDKGIVNQQLRDIWRWTVETQNAFDALPHGQLRDSLRGVRLQAGEKSPMAAYAVFMARRLAEMRRVLKPAGSIYLHCDPHANAYLRVLMDAVFGSANFRRELVWSNEDQSGFKSQANNWIRGHDIIFYYVKSAGLQKFTKQYKALDALTIRRYDKVDSDGRRYKIYNNRDGTQRIVYLKEDRGAAMSSVWNDLPSFRRSIIPGSTSVTRRKSRSRCWSASSRRRRIRATSCSTRSADAEPRRTPQRRWGGSTSA